MSVQNSLVQNKKKEITTTGYPAGVTFQSFMSSAGKNYVSKLMNGKNSDSFVTSLIAAVNQNPSIQECSYMSIVSVGLQGNALNLAPSPVLGHYYFVPFSNTRKGTKEAQFILGYKGYIQLAIRSGYYKKINVLALKEGELISFDPLTEEIKVDLIQDEETRESTPTAGYYAMFEYMNGFRKAIYWNIKKMEIHADKYSSAFNLEYHKKIQNGEKIIVFNNYKKEDEDITWKCSSFWYKDFDSMALKTLIRNLISKWGIMSIEMQTAFEKDIESENNQSEPQEPINITQETNDDPFA